MFSHEDLFEMMGGRGGGGGGGGLHSIFESLGGGGRAQRRRKGKTFMVPQEVSCVVVVHFHPLSCEYFEYFLIIGQFLSCVRMANQLIKNILAQISIKI